MFEDKTLVCKECGEEFIFTAREQEFYESKGFVNEPQRCKPCRDKRKNAGRAPREMHEAVCDSCGGVARVHHLYFAVVIPVKMQGGAGGDLALRGIVYLHRVVDDGGGVPI